MKAYLFILFINPTYLLGHEILSQVGLLDIFISKTLKTSGNLFWMTTAKCNRMLKDFPVASCENGNLVKIYTVFQGNPDDLSNTMANFFLSS